MRQSLLVLLVVFIVSYGCKPEAQYRVDRSFKVSTFYDLRNPDKVAPSETDVQISFSENGIQFTAHLSEDDIKASITRHDTTIYLDPCIELFLDPGADGKDYYEFEINALGYGWALKLASNAPPLNAPYNISSWDLNRNYKSEVYGTVNDDSDTDSHWIATMTCPWEAILEGMPSKGEAWAYNVMRIDYDQDNLPSYWVAKSTGAVNIHKPATWPIIEF